MILNLKQDFPIYKNYPQLVYLDSTATSLRPKVVIDKLIEYYSSYSANIFRGVYQISEKATEEYEETRKIVADFIGAKIKEIIFTRNATEGLNLLAYSLGRKIVEKNDEIVTTIMEHHSNFVVWQTLANENEAVLKIIDVDNEGRLRLNLEEKEKTYLEKIISKKTKLLSLTYISNVLGTINPIKEIINIAKKINPKIITIVDAAQAVPHREININDLGCDFLVFSGHKMLGPTGVGVLWGKYHLLEGMFPFLYGGEMIEKVFLEKSFFKPPPYKFEAGTPAIGEVIAFKEAIKYLNKAGMKNIEQHEKLLTSLTFNLLKKEFKDKIKIYGPQDLNYRSGIISFSFKNYHPHDVASLLNENHIAVRAGHHCAMPLHKRLGVNGTVRVSFYLYNNKEDIIKLIDGLKDVEKKLKG